jgi:hypothetical protein
MPWWNGPADEQPRALIVMDITLALEATGAIGVESPLAALVPGSWYPGTSRRSCAFLLSRKNKPKIM